MIHLHHQWYSVHLYHVYINRFLLRIFIKDVEWLSGVLGNVKESYLIDKFNHGDFIWSPRLAELVNLPITNFIQPPF